MLVDTHTKVLLGIFALILQQFKHICSLFFSIGTFSHEMEIAKVIKYSNYENFILIICHYSAMIV